MLPQFNTIQEKKSSKIIKTNAHRQRGYNHGKANNSESLQQAGQFIPVAEPFPVHVDSLGAGEIKELIN